MDSVRADLKLPDTFRDMPPGINTGYNETPDCEATRTASSLRVWSS